VYIKQKRRPVGHLQLSSCSINIRKSFVKNNK
jgi:hypothetical protein